MTPSPRRPRIGIALTGAALLAACGGLSAQQPPAPPPTRAGLVIAVRIAVGVQAPCAPLRAAYTVTPVDVPADPILADRSVEGVFTEAQGRKFCQYQTIAVFPGSGGLLPGRWRIELASFGVCTVNLAAGDNTAFFSSATTSCSKAGFP